MDNRETKEPIDWSTSDLLKLNDNLKGELNPENKVQDLGFATLAEMNMMEVYEQRSRALEQARGASIRRRAQEGLENLLRNLANRLSAQGLTKEEIIAPPPKPGPEN